MKTFTHIFSWSMSLLLVLVLAVPARAEGGNAHIQISATIRPWLKFSAQQHVQSYQVSAEDLRKGFVDLPRALSIHLQTNISHPIIFRILESNGQKLSVSETGMVFPKNIVNKYVLNNAAAVKKIDKILDVRILLSKGTIIGLYPLNTTIMAEAY